MKETGLVVSGRSRCGTQKPGVASSGLPLFLPLCYRASLQHSTTPRTPFERLAATSQHTGAEASGRPTLTRAVDRPTSVHDYAHTPYDPKRRRGKEVSRIGGT